jgi:hypothetical protein
MAVIPHPPYSPHLTSCEFFLFLKMKLKNKGRHFDSSEAIQNKLQKVMKTLMQNDFQ